MSDIAVGSTESDSGPKYTKTPKKAAASGWIGSALEYYDFFIYAQAAALVFPVIFFPAGNQQTGIVASLAIFGVGYVARPLGAFFLGQWGDKHGRKNVLVLCMVLIGGSTFLVAILPTYETAGLLGPILLTILRLIQGFAVGGEISGASAMIFEHSPFGRRGYYASYTLQGVQAGQIVAAAMFIPLARLMPTEMFLSIGWRIPFLLSAVIVVIGLVIRRKVTETPAFEQEQDRNAIPKTPIVIAIKENGFDMLRVYFMSLANSVTTATLTFGATFATSQAYGIGMAPDTFLWITVAANLVAVTLIPFVGNLSDRIGRKPVIFVGIFGSSLLIFPYLNFVAAGNTLMAFAIAIIMFGIIYQGFNAVFPSYFLEMFPTKTRVTGFAVAQNLGIATTAFLPSLYAALAGPTSGCLTDTKPSTFTGTDSCAAAASAAQTDVIWTVGGITMGLCLLGTFALLSGRETYRVHLNDLGSKRAVPVPKAEYQEMRRKVVAGK
ncbi:MAG: MFS transporter [Hyphomicrobiales bacterium]|nr:MAG: MFS transporter [Hyphomicrobiales bacterium]